MTRMHDVPSFVMAMISVGLYSALAITCFYFASKFWDRETNTLRTGRYVTPKFTFFVVLGISAVFDLPTFLTCAAKGAPDSCEWGTRSYDFCWCMHLLATVGQQYAVITPLILWSDIIHHRDGLFFNTKSQLDSVKVFFRVIWILYCCVIVMTILGVIMYPNSNDTTQISDGLMPLMLLSIALGCLFTGIRLQQHVIKVHLANDTQRRFLLQLNFLMLFITCSYALRAVMVLSLFDPMPAVYKDAFLPVGAYALWLPMTQWLPFVFCSFCLVHNMRFKGAGTSNRKSCESDSSMASRGIGMATMLEAGLDPGLGQPSMTDRGSELSMSEVVSPFDHHSNRSRSTDVSVDGYQSRSISYLLNRLHAQELGQGGMGAGMLVSEQSATARLHAEDFSRASAAPSLAPSARNTDTSVRESDIYSAFGGNERYHSQEAFDAYRDSVMSTTSAATAATGVDNFFAACALQRAASASPTDNSPAR